MGAITAVKCVAKNGQAFLVRDAVEDDAAALIERIGEYVGDGEGQIMVPGEFNMTLEKEREWIKGLRENPHQLLLVAECDGRIIGNIDFHIGKRKRTCHVGMLGISVAKEWRSQGVGAALLGALTEWARSKEQIEKIGLRVLAYNERAISLYKKFGFVQEGYSPKEIKVGPGQYVDDIQMGLILR